MVDLSDLDLPYLGLDEPDFSADPVPAFTDARKQHPWLAKCAFGYVVQEYGAIKELLSQDGKMHVGQERAVEVMGAQNTPWGDFMQRNIFALSGAEHKRIRDIVAPAFTPRQANQNRDLMRNVIARLLDEWVPKKKFDFTEFASNFPVAIICSLVGAPLSEIPRLKASLDAVGLSHGFDRSLLPALQAGIETLDDFARKVIQGRREGVRQERAVDLLDALLEMNDKGGLTERELMDLFITLLTGGYDTSKNLLGFIMSILIARPEDYRRCAEDMEFCRKVIEETLRFRSIATAMRVTNDTIVYRDVAIPAGTMLFFALPLATRDTRVVANADVFDPERHQLVKHVAFGLGERMCLGQFIARAQVQEGLHLIAQRIRNPRTTGPTSWRPFLGATGMNNFPIEFDPAPPWGLLKPVGYSCRLL